MSRPKVNVPEPPPGANLPRYLDAFADQRAAGAYWGYHYEAARLSVDADVAELLRIRNAVQQACKW
jgi:hypothetical protein